MVGWIEKGRLHLPLPLDGDPEVEGHAKGCIFSKCLPDDILGSQSVMGADDLGAGRHHPF